ncbi:MAG: sulfite exporter TauE/SafE family protein [Ignavibacteriae bacterium]|nr:sulfite exporter TauE/SafE family protein [Ignavibacteriota bacterium]
MTFILILLSAIFVSGFGSIVGFGGGVFMIPILVIVFGFPIKIAIGSVVVSLIPSAIISTLFNLNKNNIDYKAAIILEIPTIFGTILGAYLTKILSVEFVEILFSVVVLLIGYRMIKQSKTLRKKYDKNSFVYKMNSFGPSVIRKTKTSVYKINFLISGIFGSLSGMIAGFLGIGGGFLKVPIMTEIFRMPAFTASATALFMILFTSISGSFSHYFLGHIEFSKAIPVIVGFSIGAFLGNVITTNISEKVLKLMIGIGLLLASGSIIIKKFF